MKYIILVLSVWVMTLINLFAQENPRAFGISEIRWELDYKIFLKKPLFKFLRDRLAVEKACENDPGVARIIVR